jgi:hypothetical protein
MRFSEEHTLQKCIDHVESMRELLDASDIASEIKVQLCNILNSLEIQIDASFDLI